ncbi:MAG: TrmB family transcriptional regulator [Candidatus Eisenbacteria bacterium]|nr:TrmB family transcriptional regulator [Candidatus Eisenbacteria bacterium]
MSHDYDPGPLQALGFTETESLVYAYLVENSPATGYRISHEIGKQPANTYKALSSLEDKGAIVVESGQSNLCQAVPPDEVLANLERQFQRHRLEAKRELEALPSPSAYGGVFHLKTVEQVIQRARAMVSDAEKVVLCDLSPGPCRLMAETLRDAAASGALVACHVYAGERIEGVHTLYVEEHDLAAVGWPGQQISVVADSLEHVMGLLSMDMEEVHEAVWSNSNFLSCMQHNNLSAEIIAIGPRSVYSGPADDVRELTNGITLARFRPPGLESLIRRFGDGETPDPEGNTP